MVKFCTRQCPVSVNVVLSMSRVILSVFTALLLAQGAVASVARPEIRNLNLSVIIDQNQFHSSYRFAGPGGGALDKGELTVRQDGIVVTRKSVHFTLWETMPDGSAEMQVEQFAMQFTGLKAAWRGEGDKPDEDIDASLLTIHLDGQPVALNKVVPVIHGLGGRSQLLINSNGPVPRSRIGNSNITVTATAVFANKII